MRNVKKTREQRQKHVKEVTNRREMKSPLPTHSPCNYGIPVNSTRDHVVASLYWFQTSTVFLSAFRFLLFLCTSSIILPNSFNFFIPGDVRRHTPARQKRGETNAGQGPIQQQQQLQAFQLHSIHSALRSFILQWVRILALAIRGLAAVH